MPADEHLSDDQIKHVFHGTQFSWKDNVPKASYDNPLHVSATPDYPSDYAFQHGLGSGDPNQDWDILSAGRIKKFAVDPAAKIHHTKEPHMDAILPAEEQEHVRANRYDLTMFEDKLGIVYNPDVLKHVEDIDYRAHTGHHPEDEMEWMHGPDWRDEIY